MSYDKVQVGNRIRGSRLEKGWTQERLAAEAEISVQQLRALEKGQRNLGVDHLGRLSDAMGVSSDFLLKGCSENSILVCKMLNDLKKKLQPPEQIAEKWAVLLLKQYVLVLYSDENTCYNIAMAQVSVAQEGKLPEMHERLIILRELLTRAAPSSRGHCAFSS